MSRARSDLLVPIKDLHDAPLGGLLADRHPVIPGDKFHVPRLSGCYKRADECGEPQQKFFHVHFLLLYFDVTRVYPR